MWSRIRDATWHLKDLQFILFIVFTRLSLSNKASNDWNSLLSFLKKESNSLVNSQCRQMFLEGGCCQSTFPNFHTFISNFYIFERDLRTFLFLILLMACGLNVLWGKIRVPSSSSKPHSAFTCLRYSPLLSPYKIFSISRFFYQLIQRDVNANGVGAPLVARGEEKDRSVLRGRGFVIRSLSFERSGVLERWHAKCL